MDRTVLTPEEKHMIVHAIMTHLPNNPKRALGQTTAEAVHASPWFQLLQKIEGTDRIIIVEDHGGSG